MGKITKTVGELLEVNRELSKIIDDLYQIILQQKNTRKLQDLIILHEIKGRRRLNACALLFGGKPI